MLLVLRAGTNKSCGVARLRLEIESTLAARDEEIGDKALLGRNRLPDLDPKRIQVARDPIYWIATTINSPGHMHLEAMRCAWIIRIPKGQLQMRSGFSVLQSSRHPPFSEVFANNKKVILIGVLAEEHHAQTIARLSAATWGHILLQSYSTDWMIAEWATDAAPTHRRRHPIFEWYCYPNRIMIQPRWWALLRHQLDRRGLSVYDAPMGWRRYPTMTSMSVEWYLALALTKRSASALHAAVFNGTWATLRDYWNLSCGKNEEVARQGCETLLQDVNLGIKLRREQWSLRHKDVFDNRLDKRNNKLRVKGAKWHTKRARALAEEERPGR